MWNQDKSTTLSLICTRIIFAAVCIAAFFVPRITDFFIFRGTVEAQGRTQVIGSIYICLAIGAVVMYFLDRLLANIRRGEIFIPGNVSLLRKISWACFIICIPCLVITLYCKIFFFIVLAAAFLGLVLRVVKNVIEQAVAIKEENDYTV